MNLPALLTDLMAAQNGTATAKDIAAVGVSRAMLCRYVQAGLIERNGRASYSMPGVIPDELFVLSRRCERLVFSHATAMFLYGLSERTPFEHYATIRSSETVPAQLRRDVRLYYVKDEVFDLGKTRVRTQFGNEVPCFDLERTICDLVRDRNKLDDEFFISSIKNFVASKRGNLARLGEYAERLGVFGKVNAIMEVLI